MGDSSTTKELLNKYYEGLSRKKGWENLLSDNFLLWGTVQRETRGRDVYVQNGFFRLVRGLKVREMVVEGENGFALVNYDLVSPKGKTLSCDVAELWRAKAGKLDSVAIYFDTAAFNAFLA